MVHGEVWNVGRLLSWTADYLKRHGSQSPRLDAEVLLAESLDCERIDLYTRFDEEPDEAVRAALRDLVRRRAEGAPVAYLVGRREFFSRSFRVTPDVLVPRPETEHPVVAAIDLARRERRGRWTWGPQRGLRLPGRQVANCRVTAVDISPAAFDRPREHRGPRR